MLAKTNVPANSEVGVVAATIGAARGDGKHKMGFGFQCVITYVPYPTGMTA